MANRLGPHVGRVARWRVDSAPTWDALLDGYVDSAPTWDTLLDGHVDSAPTWDTQRMWLDGREAYDAIQVPHVGTKGDLKYLRILHLAVSTSEADVAVALALLQVAGNAICSHANGWGPGKPVLPMKLVPTIAGADSLRPKITISLISASC